MRFITLITTLLWASVLSAQGWELKNNLPSPLHSATAFELNHSAYLVGGSDGNVNQNTVLRYDPANDFWTALSPFPGGALRGCFSFSNDEFGFVGGGFDGILSKPEMYRFDPATNSWTQVASYPSFGRVDCYSGSLNGIGYVGGGRSLDGTGIVSDDWFSYNPQTDTWTPRASLPFGARADGVCFTLDGFIYVALGANNQNDIVDVYRYNPQTDTWTQRSPFTGAGLTKAQVFVYAGEAYVGGGARIGHFQVQNIYFKYDAQSDSWQQVPGLVTGQRAGGVGFTVLGRGYIAGGQTNNGNVRSDVWSYVQCDGVPRDFIEDVEECDGVIVNFSVPEGANHVFWSTGEESSTIQVTSSGEVWVEAIYDGCIYTDTARVIRRDGAQSIPGSTFDICAYDELTLDISDVYPYQNERVTWSNGAEGPSLTVEEPGAYFAEIETDCGIATWYVTVRSGNCGFETLFIPSAFSPNGDGVNDMFTWSAQNVEDIRIEVYNRWGDKVYESVELSGEWDGTYRGRVLPAGPFTYAVRAKTVSGRVLEEFGTITLLE
ncbi:kelch repeat-containing protein [Phaeocystidibacter luteus]|uniref:T9SS type B sorting domain-containing protein n=1 Tax=Phaeocystidibacter luteus TaxID=911197 RepID=A0A6N6RL30_9FLAO|nr:kelch repeat-containing protein [Phaeocystidibacter luteus]KAB2810232.1 T9SS type B sorting domain-containing protein [Phaeocystidibacter luteus]